MATAIYLRLSEADSDLGMEKDESNSIESQRLLLYSFIKGRDDLDENVMEYVDDGYSGTNFNRPAFIHMIEDAKKGIISVILVKDISRLGRDYITVGDYIEQIFPMLRVRFIAVNNGYDSQKNESDTMDFDMAVNNLINTFYSRDLSKKMRSANRTRWKNGINNGHVPFGYIKDPERPGKWCIDPEAAEIVRSIFNKAVEGRRTAQIAYYLNDNQIPTPGVYNMQHKLWKLGESVKPEKEQLWDSSKVHTIIRRYEYTGALVMGRHEPVIIGSHSKRMRSPKDWVIVDDVNEPIVTKEEFEEAQGIIIHKQKPELLTDRKYALKGIARCGNCRSCLNYSNNGKEEVFCCKHKHGTGRFSECCGDIYPVKDIDSYVYHALQRLFIMMNDTGSQIASMSEENLSNMRSHLKNMKDDITCCQEEKIRQYEAYAKGLITKDVYIKKKTALNKKIESLSETISRSEANLQDENNFCEGVTSIMNLVGKFQGEEKLTHEMAEAFIKDVYIYDKNHIEIIFLFEDLIDLIVHKAEKL